MQGFWRTNDQEDRFKGRKIETGLAPSAGLQM